MTKVIITTARPINSKQLGKIKEAVVKKYGKDAQVTERVDESVIGGISIMVGSVMIDATVKGKLNKIYEEYKNQNIT
jgi:F-type H+-transporting ATPase subunit delta